MTQHLEQLPPPMDEPPFDPDYDAPERRLFPVHPRPDDRTPPYNPQAEQAVLGALILDPGLAPDAALELTRGDFYDPRHQAIWDAIHDVTHKLTGDLRLDATMLADHLAARPYGRGSNELAHIGGAPLDCLGDLGQSAPPKVRDLLEMRSAVTASRRRFSQEFKDELCQEVISTSKTIKEVAVAYGVGPETLRNWLIKYREIHGGIEEAELTLTERARLKELERVVQDLRAETAFLKKASAYFARDQRL